MKAKNKYTVKFTPDESGWWVAEVVELPGCLTQGRTIDQARTRIREAIQVYLDLPKPYAGELVDEVELTKAQRDAIGYLRTMQATLKSAAAAEKSAAMVAVARLAATMSLHDAGSLIGVTKQRAHQILKSIESARSRATVAKEPRRAAAKRAS
jgi:predicted RNase H-like HicB family nuclease